MCGVAGFHGLVQSDAEARSILDRMLSVIRHRGPDGVGMFVDQDVGLGHVRLSIIDLERGHQPMTNEDGTVWVTFSGEIFNYPELREGLIQRGHTFRTATDTEVILHLYEERGPACVEAFNGDFAFALWDQRHRRLMLARDRMGVRPLYYTRHGGALLFASEIKALLQVPGISAEIDPIALDQIFTFWCPVAPRTAFRGIHELPPGHLLIAERERLLTRPYWRLEFPDRGEPLGFPGDEETAAAELRALLLDATRIRLRADVAVGAYLSGGIDSSAVVALTRHCTAGRLRTFSIGFDDPELDESMHQETMVKTLDTEHEAVRFQDSDIAGAFPQVIYHAERPVLRSAPAPLLHLARKVEQCGYRVVLTGEGADEALAGYGIFKEAKVRQYWAREPASSRRPRLLRRLYSYLPDLQAQPQPYLEAFFRVGLEQPEDLLFSHLPRWVMTSRIKRFFSEDLRRSLAGYDVLEDARAGLPPEMVRWHPLSRAQYLETTILLPGYILSSQGDRVAMAHAVEGRFPFLDHRLFEFSARLPPRLKLKVLTEKYLFRRSMRFELPPAITSRPKQPYRAPDCRSFLGSARPDYVDALLSREAISQSGYFDPDAVEKLTRKCRVQPAITNRDSMALIGILSVQLLDHLYVRRAGGRQQPFLSTFRDLSPRHRGD